MRSFALCAVALSVLLGASLARADEPTAEDYLSFFKLFVGDWETVGEVGGQRSVGTWSVKLSPTGRCLISHGTVKGQHDSDGLHGYDAQSKRFKHLGWNRDGDHTVGYTLIDAKTLKGGPVGATWKGESKGVTADGKPIASSSITTVIDKNTVRFNATDVLHDGEKQPDITITLKRMKKTGKAGEKKTGKTGEKTTGKAREKKTGPGGEKKTGKGEDKKSGQAANLLHEFGKTMAGRWIGDVTLIADWPGIGKQGDKVTAYMTIRWIADKNGLEEEWHGGQGTGKSMYVWDPASKSIKVSAVDSGGTTAEWHVWKKGDKWVWKGGGFLSDGTKFRGEGATTVKDKGSTLVYTGTCVMNGKKLLDLHDVYKRLSK